MLNLQSVGAVEDMKLRRGQIAQPLPIFRYPEPGREVVRAVPHHDVTFLRNLHIAVFMDLVKVWQRDRVGYEMHLNPADSRVCPI